MNVNLNILERVLLMNMLPKKGNLVTVRAVSNTAKILMITKEETEIFEVKNEGGMTTWNDQGKEEKEFTLPPSSVKVIRDTLYKLDAEESLPSNCLSLCEKFLPGETAEAA